MSVWTLRGALLGLTLLLSACGPIIVPKALRPQARGPAPAVSGGADPVATPLSEREVALAHAEEELLINLYERASRGVVSIFVESEELQGGSGSAAGFVLDREGRIVTNNHVVAPADRLLVTFFNLRQAEARVVGQDAHSDLAIIDVDIPSEELFPLELGDSSGVRIGQRAIAIGHPFGDINNPGGELPTLERSMTMGIVSGLGRVVSQPGGSRFALPMLIQTDANINPGNSGGPLLDSRGRVIGVNTLIFSPQGPRLSTGIGFAIPVNVLKKAQDDLIGTGTYEHPWIGISGNTVLPDMAEACGLPVKHGAIIVEVIADSPAEAAGLRGGDQQISCRGTQVTVGGDIIVGIDDRAVRTFDDLIVYLTEFGEVGQTVTLRVSRQGGEVDVPVTLGARPDELPRQP